MSTVTARITLLGPFVALLGDNELVVRGDIPKAIVARLALSPSEVVTADELIGALWSDPPDTVVSSLRAHISRLRTGGWEPLIGGGRRGYSLEVDSDEVDVLEFRRLVHATRSGETRYRDLVAAERMWRGTPLAGLEGFPFARAIIDELAGLRREATLDLARLRLDRGEHAIVATGLAPFLEQYPMDNALHEVYVRALARSGRTGDAIDAIDALRARLVESAGIQLGADFEHLRRSIVRQDPEVTSNVITAVEPVDRIGVPIPLTQFVGRHDELHLIALGRSESRLITLVGTAGVGKTRLAVEVARRASSLDDEVQWMIDLSRLTAPDQVLGAMADLVRASEPTVASIAERLGGRRGLLIVDNAEHVLGQVAVLVAETLARCEGLAVLVTSREALRVPGERVIAIAPLTGSASVDAVRLFLQRAIDATGINEWSDDQLDRMARVCQELDGLPLALELAAARLDVFTLDEVADSLPQSEGEGHDGDRHGSLDAAIAWSIALLSPTELAALSQLALFAGTFSLDAAGGICVVPDADSRDLAAALARKSLLSPVMSENGPRRFRLLDSVRAHVRRRHPSDAVDAWQQRRLEWLLRFAEEQSLDLKTINAKRARANLAGAHADLSEALDLAIRAGDRRSALRLVAAQIWHWYETRAVVEALSIADRVLAMPGEPSPVREATILRACAFISSIGSNPLDTVRYTALMETAAQVSGDPGMQLLAASMVAYVRALADEVEEADECLARSERIATEHEAEIARWMLADDLLVRGDAQRAVGRPAQALDSLAQSYRLATEIGHTWAIKGSCYVSGKALLDVNRAREALQVLRTGVARSVESADRASALAAIHIIAAAHTLLERFDEAATLYAAIAENGRIVGYSVSGIDAQYHERPLRRLREALTPVERTAAEERGVAMTLTELVHFALGRH